MFQSRLGPGSFSDCGPSRSLVVPAPIFSALGRFDVVKKFYSRVFSEAVVSATGRSSWVASGLSIPCYWGRGSFRPCVVSIKVFFFGTGSRWPHVVSVLGRSGHLSCRFRVITVAGRFYPVSFSPRVFLASDRYGPMSFRSVGFSATNLLGYR